MQLQDKIRRLAATLATLSLTPGMLLFGMWGALALHYRAPVGDIAGIALSAGFLIVGALAALAVVRRSARLFAPALVCFPVVLVWWAAIEPSQSRNWAGDVARMVTAQTHGDTLVLSNVRNFHWTGEATYEP